MVLKMMIFDKTINLEWLTMAPLKATTANKSHDQQQKSLHKLIGLHVVRRTNMNKFILATSCVNNAKLKE